MENIPMYQHIKDILKEEIRQGKSRPGDRLPSSNELAVLFSTSRNTSVKALNELVMEGAASAVKGSGMTCIRNPAGENHRCGRTVPTSGCFWRTLMT